jgi:hypothetical protein
MALAEGDGTAAPPPLQALQLLSAVELAFAAVASTAAADAQPAVVAVQDCAVRCLEAVAMRCKAADPPHTLLLSPAVQAATLLLQRAVSASRRSTVAALLPRVLAGLAQRPAAAAAHLLWLLQLLESRTLAVRREMRRHVAMLLSSLVAAVQRVLLWGDSAPRVGDKRRCRDSPAPRSHAEPCGHAEAAVLALRCSESMVGQKADLPELGAAVHQVAGAAGDAAEWLAARARASHAAGRDVLLLVCSCCSLLVALLRHRPEASPSVTARLPATSAHLVAVLAQAARRAPLECSRCCPAQLTLALRLLGSPLPCRAARTCLIVLRAARFEHWESHYEPLLSSSCACELCTLKSCATDSCCVQLGGCKRGCCAGHISSVAGSCQLRT